MVGFEGGADGEERDGGDDDVSDDVDKAVAGA